MEALKSESLDEKFVILNIKHKKMLKIETKQKRKEWWFVCVKVMNEQKWRKERYRINNIIEDKDNDNLHKNIAQAISKNTFFIKP